jgi:hypothetical protein
MSCLKVSSFRYEFQDLPKGQNVTRLKSLHLSELCSNCPAAEWTFTSMDLLESTRLMKTPTFTLRFSILQDRGSLEISIQKEICKIVSKSMAFSRMAISIRYVEAWTAKMMDSLRVSLEHVKRLKDALTALYGIATIVAMDITRKASYKGSSMLSPPRADRGVDGFN